MAAEHSIIPGVPIPYRLVITGEVVGVPESMIPGVVLSGFTGSLRLASGVRSVSVTVGTDANNASPQQGG